jgi:hypothetical protein
MSRPDFDPARALRALRDADVDFILIGGLAANLHGSPSVTQDLDICHARDPENLRRLSDVLNALHARLRGVDDEVPFILDDRTLRAGGSFTFVTDAGSLDILAMPSGVEGFEELARSAVPMTFAGMQVKVTSLDDLIRMKQAAGRPKDRIELEVLGALRRRIAERADE